VLAFGSGHGIYVATSTNEGTSFSKPVKVAEVPVLPLNRHRGPRIVISKGTIVVSAVTGSEVATGPHSHGLPSDGDLFAWRSEDGGKTWSKRVRINDIPAAAREGLHALAADGRGNVFAAWLDLRKAGYPVVWSPFRGLRGYMDFECSTLRVTRRDDLSVLPPIGRIHGERKVGSDVAKLPGWRAGSVSDAVRGRAIVQQAGKAWAGYVDD